MRQEEIDTAAQKVADDIQQWVAESGLSAGSQAQVIATYRKLSLAVAVGSLPLAMIADETESVAAQALLLRCLIATHQACLDLPTHGDRA